MHHHQYDKSSKWLIQHYGDSILRLAGVRDFVAWRPLAAELVQSRRLPDGLIEVRRRGQTEQDLYIILGGRRAMIESPLLDELKAEWTRETERRAILKILEARFGADARALETELKTIDEDRLDDLLSLAATCRSLASFRKKLSG
jgi:hypothetical protein